MPKAALHYQPESFASNDTHTRRFNQPPGVTCEAARRALLSQGYIISEAKADQVRGRKLFQPEVDRHVELEFRVVCAGQGEGQRVTEAFANGVQDQYGMRKVKSSASLGVGGVGSLSLPVQGDNDTLVKIASQTITDSQMYSRFFELMRQHLDPHASLNKAEESADASAKALPVPEPASVPAPAPLVVVVPVQSMVSSVTAGQGIAQNAPLGGGVSAAAPAVTPPVAGTEAEAATVLVAPVAPAPKAAVPAPVLVAPVPDAAVPKLKP